MPIPLLPPSPVGFPHPEQALEEPDGLLAAGGALTSEWLIEAYARGIFPWFDRDDEHVLWWSPAQRAVLQPGYMRTPRSLLKRIRNAGFSVTVDRDFEAVIDGCSERPGGDTGTWITADMRAAYTRLHRDGLAHSFETWHGDELVGGLYGIALGRVFCGESMFSRVADASKVAFFAMQNVLVEWQFLTIDCQIMNPHLKSLGVSAIPRGEFLQLLQRNPLDETRIGNWQKWLPSANLLDYAR